MRIFWDEKRIDQLEKKVDRVELKVDEVRREARADFRTLLGFQLAMFMTMIFGFAGIILQHL